MTTTTAAPEPMRSLAWKLAEVMGALHRIPKSGRNEFHGYDYATEADIVEAVRVELATRHIILISTVLEQHREPVGDKGMVLTTLKMEMTFVDGETNEWRSCLWLGAGTDKEDKGVYKAMTGALKYFLLKTFLLPTGDDPDDTPAAAKAKKPTTRTQPQTPSAPQAAAPSPIAAASGEAFTITKVWPANPAQRKPWGVVFGDGKKFTTFDDAVGERAQDLQRRNIQCMRVVEKNAKGYENLMELLAAERAVPLGNNDEPAWMHDEDGL